VWEDTYPLRRKDGVYRWFLSRAMPVTDSTGKVVRWFGTDTDITERLEAERAVHASEERFRRALEIETVGIVFFDTDGAITGANDAFLRMGGYTREDLSAGRVRWDALTPPEWMPRSLGAALEFKATGRITPYEREYLRKDGSRRWALFAATRLNEREGVEFVVDVTERKIGEAERDRLVARLAFVALASARLSGSLELDATLATIADLVVPELAEWCAVEVVDDRGRPSSLVTRHADPARAGLTEELFRRPVPSRESPDAAEGTGASELLPDVAGWLAQAEATVSRKHDILRALGPRSYICVPLVSRRRALGRLSLGSAPTAPAYGPADLALAEDLAQRAALAVDNARLYIEATEAIRIREAFVARASHELRTPLTSVVATIALLKKAITGELRESPEALIDMANRNLATTLAFINDLLDVSKLAAGQETLAIETVDLGAAAGRAMELVSSQARRKRVVIRTALPAGLRLTADRLKLEQVISNLLGNAVKFSPAGGEVVVSAERAGGWVLLRVRDQGEGIAPDELDRIFEPFYQSARARAQRRGTGLGLAICRQIVALHGGRIWAESEGPGHGTTVCVQLPRKAATDEAA
jgi:PAS domain S-box-containing protein